MIFFLKFQVHSLVCLLFQIISQSLCRNVFSWLLCSLEIKLLHVETTELTNYTTSLKLSHLKISSLLGSYIRKTHINIKLNQLRPFPPTKFISNKGLLSEQGSEFRLQKSTGWKKEVPSYLWPWRAAAGLQAVEWCHGPLLHGTAVRLDELMRQQHRDAAWLGFHLIVSCQQHRN